MSTSVALSSGIEKSVSDDREYRHVKLANNLNVLLVSDPEADYASAAMCVKVGQFSDPDNVPGLAHFCEHMLFLGTEKYPDENSYSSYLNKHGGWSNAYTASEDTNYFFEVQQEHLEEALDRFAQFFIAPLFTESCVDRELQAVNSENTKNLQNDHWRLYQLSRSTARPGHPYNKFGTGNLETLKDTPAAEGVNVRDELLKFHSTYYSANQMRLAVVGKDSLDTLQAWAEEKFSAINNSGRDAPKFESDAFGPEQLGVLTKIVPVKDLRQLNAQFLMPTIHGLYSSKPTRYLSHLLGHEGPGSLLSYLKSRNWATGLSAGCSERASSFSLFDVGIELTPSGLEAVDEIVGALLRYIALLKEEGPKEWIWNECRDTASMSFRFRSKERPGNFATTLARQMHVYPPEHYVSGPYLYRTYDAKEISRFLDCLAVSNLRVGVISQSFDGTTESSERWYGTKYTSTRFSEAQVAGWSEDKSAAAALRLPEENNLIATDFSLRYPKSEASPEAVVLEAGAGAGAGDDSGAAAEAASIFGMPVPQVLRPEVIRDDKLVRVWYKADTQFYRPKISFTAQMSTPVVSYSPRHKVLSRVFTKVVKDSLNEFSYNATLAELDFSLTASDQGIQLSVSGFNHKLPVLLAKVADKIVNVEFTEEEFERQRFAYEKKLQNFQMEQPYRHCIRNLGLLTSTPVWGEEQLLEEISSITAAELRAFIPQLLSQLYVEALVYGNASPEDALGLVNSMLEPFVSKGAKALLPSQHRDTRIVKLPAGIEFMHSAEVANAAEENSAVEAYFQVGPFEPVLQSKLSVVANLMKEPAFDQLRTKEQLGYIVFALTKSQSGVNGLRIIVQSPSTHAAELDNRIEAFLANYKGKLAALSDEDFADNVKAVAAKLLEIPKTPNQVAANIWYEIGLNRYCFDQRQQQAKALMALTKEDCVQFFNHYIARGGAGRRKLSALMVSSQHAAAVGATTTTTLVSGLQGEEMVTSGVAVQRSTPRPAMLSLDEGLDLAAVLGQDGAISAVAGKALDAVRQKYSLSSALAPVAEVTDIDVFRSSLPLHAVSGRRARGSTISRL